MARRPRAGYQIGGPRVTTAGLWVGPALQVRFPTSLTDEEYVSQRAWNLATAPDCRGAGGTPHKLAPHGFYARVKPPGTWIRRRGWRRGPASRAAAVEQARPAHATYTSPRACSVTTRGSDSSRSGRWPSSSPCITGRAGRLKWSPRKAITAGNGS